MVIGIDASNIKAGGGLTHLKRIVESFNSKGDNLLLIGGDWLNKIDDKANVQKIILEKEFSSVWRQEFFKFFKLRKYFKNVGVVFAPGGTFSDKSIDYVSMSQNMLVFENKERNRFPKSFTLLRYLILEKIQLRSFKNATGIIYISNYAKNYIEQKYPILKTKKSTVIYHGISDDFRQKPKEQFLIQDYTKEKPFKLLYVSIINYYKHQWNVIEAVKNLRKKGYNIILELVGPMYPSLTQKMDLVMQDTQKFIFYRGRVNYEEVAKYYQNTDLFIFASTCENMPNILVEAMSSGLPILSSSYGPMPEILKDGGCYIDPLNIEDIESNLEKLLLNRDLRQSISEKAYNYSLEFSWSSTALKTFDFLKRIASNINETNNTIL